MYLFNLGPKNDPPSIVQEKVLSLIQSWADAFRNQPDLQGVYQVYKELRQKGIEFPMTNLDTMAPIHTPHKVSSIILKCILLMNMMNHAYNITNPYL